MSFISKILDAFKLESTRELENEIDILELYEEIDSLEKENKENDIIHQIAFKRMAVVVMLIIL